MCENNLTNKKTPLRNSNTANKPFRSPLTTVMTPKNNESPRNVHQSPMQKSATPKRTTPQCRLPLKRRRIDNVPSSPGAKENDDKALARSDILAAKRRINTKRRELDDLRRTLHYIRKHDKENLLVQISKWRTACKEALFDFHKRIRDKSSENVTMRQVLAMLGIAEETVKFTDEECDLN